MDRFTVSFFGHRQIDDPLIIEEKLENIIQELLQTKEYVEFLIGRDGEFDQLAASVIRRCRRTVRDDNSALVLVLPYTAAECRNKFGAVHKYYDEIEVCAASAEMHFKAAHQARNRSMVDRSDLVVFYVCHSFGGAYRTRKYAASSGSKYLDLA